MDRFAHSVEGAAETHWEPLSHHLAAVGQTAAGFAAPFGGSTIVRAMGLLHDIGKQSEAYQRYIRRPRDSGGPKGPDHSTAGAKEAWKLYGDKLGLMMGFGIAGHHGGLMDGSGHEGGTLPDRLNKLVEDYMGWEGHVTDLPTRNAAMAGLPRVTGNAIEPGFTFSFLVRMLFSCLVDADFPETERFYALLRKEPPPPRGGTLTAAHRDTVRAFLARHRKTDTPVNILRSDILDHANGKAANRSFRPDVIASYSAATTASPTNSDGVSRVFFAKLKQWRRIATRYGKLAANFLGFINLASIMLWLK